MNLYHLSEAQILVFGLIMLRMSGFIFSSAIFNAPVINLPVKVLLSLALAMLMYPLAKISPEMGEGFQQQIIQLALRETMVGISIGFLTRLFFFTVSMTGELVSTSLGLNSAQIFNPMIGQQAGVVEQFHSLIGMMIFLAINGHHMMISALAYSFEIIQVGNSTLHHGPYIELAGLGQNLLLLSIKMSAPVMVAILLTNISMGILGKAIPQMNVLVTSFPVTILLGMLVVFICMPLVVMEMNGISDFAAKQLMALIRALGAA